MGEERGLGGVLGHHCLKSLIKVLMNKLIFQQKKKLITDCELAMS